MSESSPPAITTDQMREVDRLMIEEYGISLEQMMENAGRNLADLALRLIGRAGLHRVAVACGGGNNGGGGMVAARFLSNHGCEVTAVLTTSPSSLKPIPAARWHTLEKLPVTTIVANVSDRLNVFEDVDLIIDAVIGYGLRDEPRGIPAHVLREIHNSGNPDILSLDVPSGLDSTTGVPASFCIRASVTITLALPKTGLLEPAARECIGDLYLADIGVPPSLYEQMGISVGTLFSEDSILKISF